MRWVRAGLLAGLAVKAVIVGAWWCTSVAHAERLVAEASVAPDLFAKSRGFRELLEAVRQRGEELDRREQALATRERAVGTHVQLAQEFIDLISTQRRFQANTRVITASDTLLGDLVNII